MCFVGFSRFSSHAHVYRRASCLMSGLLHVWEAERRNRRFGRASRELDVPLTVVDTVACGMVMTAHPDSCTRALCAGAGIQVRRQSEQTLERESE